MYLLICERQIQEEILPHHCNQKVGVGLDMCVGGLMVNELIRKAIDQGALGIP